MAGKRQLNASLLEHFYPTMSISASHCTGHQNKSSSALVFDFRLRSVAHAHERLSLFQEPQTNFFCYDPSHH